MRHNRGRELYRNQHGQIQKTVNVATHTHKKADVATRTHLLDVHTELILIERHDKRNKWLLLRLSQHVVGADDLGGAHHCLEYGAQRDEPHEEAGEELGLEFDVANKID